MLTTARPAAVVGVRAVVESDALGNYVKNVGNTNDAQCAVFPDNS